jgi:hypothetical protein
MNISLQNHEVVIAANIAHQSHKEIIVLKFFATITL